MAETLPTGRDCGTGSQDAQVQFGYAYYILLVGGLFSLGGAAFNLLFARSAAERRRLLRLRFRLVVVKLLIIRVVASRHLQFFLKDLATCSSWHGGTRVLSMHQPLCMELDQ